jgi:hypothetical protein
MARKPRKNSRAARTARVAAATAARMKNQSLKTSKEGDKAARVVNDGDIAVLELQSRTGSPKKKKPRFS